MLASTSRPLHQQQNTITRLNPPPCIRSPCRTSPLPRGKPNPPARGTRAHHTCTPFSYPAGKPLPALACTRSSPLHHQHWSPARNVHSSSHPAPAEPVPANFPTNRQADKLVTLAPPPCIRSPPPAAPHRPHPRNPAPCFLACDRPPTPTPPPPALAAFFSLTPPVSHLSTPPKAPRTPPAFLLRAPPPPAEPAPCIRCARLLISPRRAPAWLRNVHSSSHPPARISSPLTRG